MTRILILGAHGQIARVATELFLDRTDAEALDGKTVNWMEKIADEQYPD